MHGQDWHRHTDHQLRKGIEDNSKIIFISQQKHVMTPHKNRVDSSSDGSQHLLKELYGKLFPDYPFYPFLSVTLGIQEPERLFCFSSSM